MSTTSSSSSARTPTKRLLTELSAFAASPPQSHPGIEALAPISSSSLLSLHAIINASYPSVNATNLPSSSTSNNLLSSSSLPYPPVPKTSGYAAGRWLLEIKVPENYPVAPPTIRFVTRICHPNVKWETGEICLDVLKEAWSPVLGVVGALECVVRLLGEPGVDSPLGVEIAALVRGGDRVGARALVGYWTGEERFEGVLE